MGLPFWSAWQVWGAALLLAAITGGAVLAGRRRGYLLVGWLWFAGMLLPMIGLIPAGLRVMHDRYTYVPMIGIAVALVFGGATAARRFRIRPALAAVAAVPLLVACALLSWRQVGVWQDSLTLFDHALSINERNAIIHAGRGSVYLQQGDFVRARAAYEAALAIHPDYPDVNNNLGLMLMQRQRLHEAIPYLRRAVAARPDSARELVNLGNALFARGSAEEGLALLRRAVAAEPESATAHYWVGAALQQLGRLDEAGGEYREALRIDPENPWAQRNLDAIEARSSASEQ
jgi:tetratricopeptide (TPR) repeat protein